MSKAGWVREEEGCPETACAELRGRVPRVTDRWREGIAWEEKMATPSRGV
jgi:hypothetical protein